MDVVVLDFLVKLLFGDEPLEDQLFSEVVLGFGRDCLGQAS